MNKLVIDSKASKPLGVKIHTKKIVGKEEFKCRAEDLYRALTDVKVSKKKLIEKNKALEMNKKACILLLEVNLTGHR